jgi:DNA-binding transcriptional LysR family regulator
MDTMIPNLDIDQLKTFLAIADTGSFTKAAGEVNKTQSAVSMQIKRLEENLGRTLFARDGRMSKFTADGERFIEQARKLVTMNDEIVSGYLKPELSGTVRFGTPDDYAELILPDVLARFHRTHPLISTEVECVSSGQLKDSVKRGDLDLALVTFKRNEVLGEVLRREELRWVGSARHNTHGLNTLPLAAAEVGCEWRGVAMGALEEVNRKFRVAYTCSSRAAVDALVLNGLAIAATLEVCIKPGMRVLTEADGLPRLGSFDIGLMSKPGKPSCAADTLACHIRESFGRPDAARIAAE